jgi:hypothetical protein
VYGRDLFILYIFIYFVVVLFAKLLNPLLQ